MTAEAGRPTLPQVLLRTLKSALHNLYADAAKQPANDLIYIPCVLMRGGTGLVRTTQRIFEGNILIPAAAFAA
jgi:hypothetical protein